MYRGVKKTHSFLKNLARKFSKTFPVLVMVLLVFSVSVYAWLNTSASNNGNTIKTGATFAKVELLKDGQEVYSADDLRELNQAVAVDAKSGDEFILRITNSGEISMRYVISAVVNGTEFVTMTDDGSGLRGNVLNVGENSEYTVSLDEDASNIILRLTTSYTNISPNDLGELPEITEGTEEVTEKASEEVTEKPADETEQTVTESPDYTESSSSSDSTEVTEPKTEVTEATEAVQETVPAETAEPTAAEESTAPSEAAETEAVIDSQPAEISTEMVLDTAEPITDPTEAIQ